MPNYYKWTTHGEKSIIPGGSVSIEHRKRGEEEPKDPIGIEMNENKKRLKDGNLVCPKAQQVMDESHRPRTETQASDEGSSSIVAEKPLYIKLVGGKRSKGNVWGTWELVDLPLNQTSTPSSQQGAQEDPVVFALHRKVVALMTELGEVREVMESYIHMNDTRFQQVLAERDDARAAARAAAESARVATDAANHAIVAATRLGLPPLPCPQPSSVLTRVGYTHPPDVPDRDQDVYLS